MTGTINNGRREEVSFGSYDGEAGIVELDGVTEVAFPSRTAGFSPGMIGVLDDAGAYRVTAVRKSALVRGMIVLTVEAVTPAATA